VIKHGLPIENIHQNKLWIGKEDEVLDAIKVISFFKENNPKSFTKIVEGEKHLSILLTVSNHIGPWIHDIVQ
jgi:hypothetical protein